MDIDPADIVTVFDRIGVVAFALAGVQVGARRQLDVFGLLVMGVVASTGGGLMRDVVLTRTPLVIDQWDYLVWAIGASLLAIILVSIRRNLPTIVLQVADAVGLGAFAVAGAFAAIEAGLELPAVLLLSVLTATGGGVIRDLLADRVPMVLRAEVNATAAVAGGFAVWAVWNIDSELTGIGALVGAFTTALVRIAGVAFGLNLPVPGVPDKRNDAPPARESGARRGPR